MRLRTAGERRGALWAALVVLAAGAAMWVPAGLAPPSRPAAPTSVPPVTDARVDLNRADAGSLTRLPGIGPVLAERIVSHRMRHGGFESVDDLRAVRGIGPRLIERIRDRVRAGVAPDSLLR